MHYILCIANNWVGSIGRFRLIVDRKTPENLVGLCRPGKLRKISPTWFESIARDFTPHDDLAVPFITDLPRD